MSTAFLCSRAIILDNGHPKSQEATVQRRLQPDARLKQPGHQQILAPFETLQLFGQAATRDRHKNTRDLVAGFYFGVLAHFQASGESFLQTRSAGW
jgi:hypothetical protein